MWVERFPLTPNGKVDRRSLSSSATVAVPARQGAEPPVNDIERDLAAIWAAALGLHEVGTTDNFFALGGNSIRSIRVRTLARRRGHDVELTDFFRYPTIRELTAALALRSHATAEEAPDPAPWALISEDDRGRLPDDAEDAYPLAALQSGMLFHGEVDPESGLYHDVFSFHVRLPWRRDAFERALAATVARHPALRTSFDRSTFRQPLQIVHRHAVVETGLDDLEGVPSGEQDVRIEAWIAAEARRGFREVVPPLFRAHVHRRSDTTLQLSFSVHHAILDGWSLSTLLTELLRGYLSTLESNDEAFQAPPSARYRDFVVLETSTMVDPRVRAFWEAQLANLPVLTLPPRREPAEPAAQRRVTRVSAMWDAETVARLSAVAERSTASLKSTLLAVHMAVLAALVNQREVVTGLVSNGRPEEDGADEVLGLFLNTIPICLATDGCSWAELIAKAFDEEGRLLPYRRFPLAQLQKMRGRAVLSDTAFNFVHLRASNRSWQTSGSRCLARGITKRPVSRCSRSSTSICSAEASSFASTSRRPPSRRISVKRLRILPRAVDALVTDPGARCEATALLSDAEHRRLIVGFNTQPTVDRLPSCLHERLALSAQPDPGFHRRGRRSAAHQLSQPVRR